MKKVKLAALTFTALFSLNCFWVYGQDINVGIIGGADGPTAVYVKSDGLKKNIMMEMADEWAQAWKSRSGILRYNIMSDEMKKEFEEKQGTTDEGDLITSIRWSSPWVESYTIDVDEETETAEIKYIMADSGGDYYVMWDYIAFNYNADKNKTEVAACNTSDLFGYDKVTEIVNGDLETSSYLLMDYSSLPYEAYYQIKDTVKGMISPEIIYKDKIITNFDFKQTQSDNIGKIVIDDIDMSVTYTDLPVNPAKDESLKKLKAEDYDEYIKLFSEYNTEKSEKYALRVKVDLETEGIISVELKHKEKVE